MVSDKQLQDERLACHKVFDYSDIRINVDEKDSEGNEFVLARCFKDHIELIAKSWISEFKYLENFVYVINHESLHVIIETIVMEDGFDLLKIEPEWMFYAGAMDELNGINMSKSAPTLFLNKEAVINTMKMFPLTSFQCKETLHGDYDL